MVKDNIARIREKIALACSRVNRDSSGIRIIAVSKGRSIKDIKEAVSSGLTDIGENRVQEALDKYSELKKAGSSLSIKWHMIGHLQTNKVKDAVAIFDLIHSVDSLALAQEIDRRAARINKVQDILIEVKTSPEATKFGLDSGIVSEIIPVVAQFKNINVKGFMTIAPLLNQPEKAKRYFKMLRQMRDSINPSYYLSMGMTYDFEAAIEEGADILRIGRGIFEN